MDNFGSIFRVHTSKPSINSNVQRNTDINAANEFLIRG